MSTPRAGRRVPARGHLPDPPSRYAPLLEPPAGRGTAPEGRLPGSEHRRAGDGTATSRRDSSSGHRRSSRSESSAPSWEDHEVARPVRPRDHQGDAPIPLGRLRLVRRRLPERGGAAEGRGPRSAFSCRLLPSGVALRGRVGESHHHDDLKTGFSVPPGRGGPGEVCSGCRFWAGFRNLRSSFRGIETRRPGGFTAKTAAGGVLGLLKVRWREIAEEVLLRSPGTLSSSTLSQAGRSEARPSNPGQTPILHRKRRGPRRSAR